MSYNIYDIDLRMIVYRMIGTDDWYFEQGSKLRIKMEENAFPFGAKFGADQYETIEEEWKYYFNYG